MKKTLWLFALLLTTSFYGSDRWGCMQNMTGIGRGKVAYLSNGTIYVAEFNDGKNNKI